MIILEHLSLYYKKKRLLNDTSFEAAQNEIVFIKGKSGCGKTTLLYALSLLIKVEGNYYWNHQEITHLSDSQKADIRKTQMGIVMQDCMLYSHMSVKDNICYYASLNNIQMEENEIIEYLKELHMEDSLHKKVKTLSGGEQQRIALICAVVKKPQVLLLDEPTSQLDKNTELLVMDWLEKIKKKERICIIITTHKDIDHYADKIYIFENNQLKLNDYHKKYENNQSFNQSHNSHHQFYKKSKQEIFQLVKQFILFLIIPFITLELNSLITFYNQHQIDILEESSIKMIYNENYQVPTVYIDDREVDLLFYVPQNKLNDRAIVTYVDNGCYINQSVYQDLHRDLKNKSLSINYKHKKLDYPVSGILNNDSIINKETNDYCLYLPLEQYKEFIGNNPVISIDSLDNLEQYSSKQIIFNDDLQILKNYQNTKEFYSFLNTLISIVYVISVFIFTFLWVYKNRKNYFQKYIDGLSKRYLFIEFCIMNIIFFFGQTILSCIILNNMNILLILSYLGIFYIVFILVYGLTLYRLTLNRILRY